MCMHAEENAVIEVGKTKTKGSTIYVNLCPCLQCLKVLIQAGITRVVYSRPYHEEHL